MLLHIECCACVRNLKCVEMVYCVASYYYKASILREYHDNDAVHHLDGGHFRDAYASVNCTVLDSRPEDITAAHSYAVGVKQATVGSKVQKVGPFKNRPNQNPFSVKSRRQTVISTDAS